MVKIWKLHRDALQEGIDHKMLCFSELTTPSKNPNQREAELQKQRRGLGYIEDGNVVFGHVPNPDSDDDDEEDEV